MRTRIGVLISGRGSNMEALIKAAAKFDYPAEIGTVVSNRPEAGGLGIAARLGIEAVTIDHSAYASRGAFEEGLDRHLRSCSIDYVACAGFMRILTREFLERWRNRIVNIHPSLLPCYGGLHTHERAIADGVRIHGCTVHFVRPTIDSGPIVAQAAVPVYSADTAGTLAARVLQVEHVIYPRVVAWLAAGLVTVDGERVIYRFNAATTAGAALVSPMADAADSFHAGALE
jgi:phosphoribosylglycinamide formyltransferase-1